MSQKIYQIRLDSGSIKNIMVNMRSPINRNLMIKPLTEKQLRFLSFLKERLQEMGYPPTVREIMDGLGLSSTNMVKKYLHVLARKGYIRRQLNSPRAIE